MCEGVMVGTVNLHVRDEKIGHVSFWVSKMENAKRELQRPSAGHCPLHTTTQTTAHQAGIMEMYQFKPLHRGL